MVLRIPSLNKYQPNHGEIIGKRHQKPSTPRGLNLNQITSKFHHDFTSKCALHPEIESADESPSAAPSHKGYILRQLRLDDVDATAALCFSVFGDAAKFRSEAEWAIQIEGALLSKFNARRETQLRRLFAPSQSPTVSRRHRLLRFRSFFFFLAIDRATNEIIGSVALSYARPEAALPPPLPTKAPRRSYVSNMAVACAHRRRGVAAALLARCERVAGLIGADSLWLHVDRGNTAAEELYFRRGYEEVGGLFWGAARRRLLRIRLSASRRPRWKGFDSAAGVEVEAIVGGGSRGDEGVYVWQVAAAADEESEANGNGGGAAEKSSPSPTLPEC